MWNDDWRSLGWHDGLNESHDTSAGSVSVGSSDLGAVSNPKRFEWVKMNLDTGAAVEQETEDSTERPVVGFIPDGGAWQSQGHDENG